jgi:hypothetical protein
MHGEYSSFYDHSEHYIRSLVGAHINMRRIPLTKFSSWAASLHAVLCYGAYMTQINADVYISVIDTQQLQDVVVFNTAHLVAEPYQPHRVIEYLARGRINGRGYKAVSLQEMADAGLANLFPLKVCKSREPVNPRLKIEAFGFELRHAIFSKRPRLISSKELNSASRISALFEGFGLPVMTALLCLKPRSWQNCRADGITTDAQDIEKVLGAVKTLRMIANDTWLQSNMVYTLDSPDIDQWIDLLYAMVQYSAQEGSKYPFNGGEDGSDDGPQHGTADGSEHSRGLQTRYELRRRR